MVMGVMGMDCAPTVGIAGRALRRKTPPGIYAMRVSTGTA